MTSAHIRIRNACRLTEDVVSAIPQRPFPFSRLGKEVAELKGRSTSVGMERALILQTLSVDARVMLANLILVVEGVADCLEVAEGRDNRANTPVLSITVRPALEMAGQIAWLLDNAIDADTRSRRSLVWRFADLEAQQKLLANFRSDDDTAEAVEMLDSDEDDLLATATRAEIGSRPSSVDDSGNRRRAGVLKQNGKLDMQPNHSELVQRVSSSPSVYALLSLPTHGVRFASYQGIEPTGGGDGRTQVSGFGLDPNTAIGLGVLSLDLSCRHLAGWNSVDATALHSAIGVIMVEAGFNDVRR